MHDVYVLIRGHKNMFMYTVEHARQAFVSACVGIICVPSIHIHIADTDTFL
jgi:hypothetical protein